jgi:hypothetical protein
VKDRLKARKAVHCQRGCQAVPKGRGKLRGYGALSEDAHPPTGLQVPSSFLRIFPLVNWVSPTGPTLAWYPNRKEGGWPRG